MYVYTVIKLKIEDVSVNGVYDGWFVFSPSLPNMACLVSVIKATIGVQEMQLSNVDNKEKKKRKKKGGGKNSMCPGLWLQ